MAFKIPSPSTRIAGVPWLVIVAWGKNIGLAQAEYWLANGDFAKTALEISYRAAFGKHFALQPDFQFVFNPGADSMIRNAVISGVRLEISF